MFPRHFPACLVPAGQHICPHSQVTAGVPHVTGAVGHTHVHVAGSRTNGGVQVLVQGAATVSHLQVVELKLCPVGHRVFEAFTHCAGTLPPPGQQTSPGAQQSVSTAPLVTPAHGTAQAQWKSEPQKCVQHSAFELQLAPGSRHLRLWLAAASGARTTESTAPAAAAAATLRNLRREVLAASVLPSSSNLSSALIAVPPCYIALGGKPLHFGLRLSSTPSSFPFASSRPPQTKSGQLYPVAGCATGSLRPRRPHYRTVS
jgi:hypothetical protein